jgi:DNA-binding CsgD family transcriptional regulator
MPPPRLTPAAAEWLAATADVLGTALFVVDGDGCLQHSNHAAQALLQGPALMLAQGRLGLRNDEIGTRRIDAALRRALRPARGSQVKVALAAGEHRRIVVIPLSTTGTAAAAPAAALLVLPADRSVSIALLAHSHGLSSAESAALDALARGLTPGEIASALGITQAAARARLARVRVKTRLPSLASLQSLLRGLPPLAPSAPHAPQAPPLPTTPPAR